MCTRGESPSSYTTISEVQVFKENITLKDRCKCPMESRHSLSEKKKNHHLLLSLCDYPYSALKYMKHVDSALLAFSTILSIFLSHK